jgi:hypothetical protein
VTVKSKRKATPCNDETVLKKAVPTRIVLKRVGETITVESPMIQLMTVVWM